MPKIVKIFLSLFLLFCILVFITISFMLGYHYHNKPIISGMLQTPHGALLGQVSITRDSFGIAHIKAQKSDLDAWFALGYTHAQDRFWQMEFNRHVEQGTLSEIFGIKTLSKDKYLRTWGFYRHAKSAWPMLSPHTQAVIQSYTNGINFYISQQKFPIQFFLLGIHPKPWTVIDSLAWQKVLAWDLQSAWKSKLDNYLVKKNSGEKNIPVYFPPYPKNAPTILSDGDLKQSKLYSPIPSNSPEHNLVNSPDKGSNNWVVSGKWTTSGKPILANDPHLEIQSPSTWYYAHLEAPGLNITGATMPGMPGIVIGHNDHIAWGVTNVNPDTQDLYIISPDQKKNLQIIDEVISIKNHPAIHYPVRYYNNMPIISDVTDTKQIGPDIALRWTAFNPEDNTAQSIINIDYAKNWKEFTQALKDFDTPSQNFVYADTEGNIGYYLSGKIPLKNWNNTALPAPYDNAHQWTGYIPFEELPHVFNPPEGFIASANNLPVSNHYQYQSSFKWCAPPFRIERIINLLHSNKPLDREKIAAIQQDTHSLLWQDLSLVLLKTHPKDHNSQVALNTLKHWNGNADTQSIGATLFATWYNEIGLLIPSYIDPNAHYPEPPLYMRDKICQNNSPQLFSDSLQFAMKKLTAHYGHRPENWVWGNAHRADFKELGLGVIPILNQFWNRSASTAGGLYTVNPGTYNAHGPYFIQNDGASLRQIMDLSDFNKSLYILTLGQNNDPFSPHYQDQLPLWQQGKYLSIDDKKPTLQRGASTILILN